MADLIPAGYYNAVAAPVEGEDGIHLIRWARAGTGTMQCLIYFEILDGEHKGQRLPWFGYFSKDAYKRTLESLRHCGLKGEDVLNPGPLDQIVSVSVEHEEYEVANEDTGEVTQRTRARISWVNRAGGGVIKLKNPLSADEARKFAAQLRNALRGIPETQGERVGRAAPAQATQAKPAPSNGSRPAARGAAPSQDPWGAGPAIPPPADDDIPF